MNQKNYADLGLIGTVQHGIQESLANGSKRAKELGHFIAKVEDPYMQKFLQKFKEQYEGKDYIEISFCEDSPLIKKYVRYNQGGKVCHCAEGSTTASQKVNNKWKQIECANENCEYRQKNDYGKSLCNRIAWLRFFIPSISQDRLWLMKITGQKSINRLDAFFKKSQSTLLQDSYILFLKQEEQTNKTTGQTFNNYILNIMLKKDFILAKPIPQANTNNDTLSPTNTDNVNNNVEKTLHIQNTNKETNSDKKTTKKTSKDKKSKTIKQEETKTDSKDTETNFDNYYVLVETQNTTLMKDGKPTEYFLANFVNSEDKQIDVIVPPSLASELEQCDIGTTVKLDLETAGTRTFTKSIEYIQKCLKNVAA